MVVTLRAADGEAHQRGGNNLQCLGHHLIAGGGVVRARTGAIGRHPQEAGGGELVDLLRL